MPEQTYSTRIFWSPEDGCFVAICPELGDVSSFGETPDQAAAELKTAVALVIEQHCDEGRPAPEPAHLPAFSGQFRLRIPRGLHEWLAVEAEREGVSLNTFVVARLSEVRGAWAFRAEVMDP